MSRTVQLLILRPKGLELNAATNTWEITLTRKETLALVAGLAGNTQPFGRIELDEAEKTVTLYGEDQALGPEENDAERSVIHFIVTD